MKRIFVVMMIILVCNTSLLAMDHYYQALRNGLVRFGEAIENVEGLPVINKLTNILPFAVVAASFKECPIQTVAVLTCVLLYILSHHEGIRSKLDEYDVMNRTWLKRKQEVPAHIDESLFIFDGEDEDDAEEENETEDDLFEDDDGDIKRSKQAQPAVFQRL
ncbi:MAG TPA: hypothetical protein VJJ26_04625 [Candidatus Babeliales bacterium]|nr:hypothetical protein [Candidatus Babeliales bacterium]